MKFNTLFWHWKIKWEISRAGIISQVVTNGLRYTIQKFVPNQHAEINVLTQRS